MRIGIDTEELLGYSADLKAREEDFNSLVEQMKGIIGNIPNAWEGDASRAFIEQFESLQPSFESVRDLIESISTQIKQAVSATENLDTEISGVFKQ